VGLGTGHIVLDGDPALLPKKGAEPPQFSADFYCDQTAGCIKMPLGTEVGLCLRDIVLDGDLALPPPKGTAPKFSANVSCGQTAGWTKMPLCIEVGLGPGDFVFDGDPTTPEKGHTHPPPNVWPISIVAKRLDGSRCHMVRM